MYTGISLGYDTLQRRNRVLGSQIASLERGAPSGEQGSSSIQRIQRDEEKIEDPKLVHLCVECEQYLPYDKFDVDKVTGVPNRKECHKCRYTKRKAEPPARREINQRQNEIEKYVIDHARTLMLHEREIDSLKSQTDLIANAFKPVHDRNLNTMAFLESTRKHVSSVNKRIKTVEEKQMCLEAEFLSWREEMKSRGVSDNRSNQTASQWESEIAFGKATCACIKARTTEAVMREKLDMSKKSSEKSDESLDDVGESPDKDGCEKTPAPRASGRSACHAEARARVEKRIREKARQRKPKAVEQISDPSGSDV